MERQKRNNGITLIALVITIVVLLILAGISIAMLTGENGIVTQAQRASEQTQIASEEERINLAVSGALLKDNGGKIAQENLENELENYFDRSDFLVIKGANGNGEEGFIVTITENVEEGREYFVNENGTVEEYEEPQVSELTDIYVTLYTDGTLALSNNNQQIEGKTVDASYGNIKDEVFEIEYTDTKISLNIPWMEINATNPDDAMEQIMNESEKIKQVTISDRIVPKNTSYWFFCLMNVRKIEGIENLDTSNVTDMSNMFSGCSGLNSIDLSKFNTSNVTDMGNMFYGCSGLNSIDLSKFNTSNVTDMSNMFSGCSGLNSIDLSKFNTSNVTDMSFMFYECSGLNSIDLSSFDTKNVTDMMQMFWNCRNLESLDISSFDILEDTNITNLFTNGSYKVEYTVYVKNEETINILKSEYYNEDIDIQVK